MGFRITGLSAEPFRRLYGLSDRDLAIQGVKRYVADRKPGFPDQIEMRNVAENTYDRVDEVPEVMRVRLLSLRAYVAEGMMLDADVVDGKEIEAVISRCFESSHVAYIHAHNAKRGCYSGRIDRV